MRCCLPWPIAALQSPPSSPPSPRPCRRWRSGATHRSVLLLLNSCRRMIAPGSLPVVVTVRTRSATPALNGLAISPITSRSLRLSWSAIRDLQRLCPMPHLRSGRRMRRQVAMENSLDGSWLAIGSSQTPPKHVGCMAMSRPWPTAIQLRPQAPRPTILILALVRLGVSPATTAQVADRPACPCTVALPVVGNFTGGSHSLVSDRQPRSKDHHESPYRCNVVSKASYPKSLAGPLTIYKVPIT